MLAVIVLFAIFVAIALAATIEVISELRQQARMVFRVRAQRRFARL